MRITQIEISDTYGCQHVKFSPGTVTRIKGVNGSGKSSLLRALATVFEGGLDSSVIRKGAEKSVVEILLDDGTKITKTTAPIKRRKGADPNEPLKYRADLEITDAAGVPLPSPKTFVDDLSRHLAVDPSILLRLDATTAPGRKALAAELMKLVPLAFPVQEVIGAFERRPGKLPPDPDTVPAPATLVSDLGLDDLKKLQTQVTEQRRRIGQEKDAASGTVDRLRKSLPEDGAAAVDYPAKLSELETEALDIERAIADRRVQIANERNAEVQAAETNYSERLRALNQEIDAKIRELEEERARCGTALRDERERIVKACLKVERECLDDLEKEASPEQQRVAGEIAVCKQQIEGAARAATLREEIQVQEEVCRMAWRKYDRCSEVLDNLEQLRLDKLNHLPVAGLVVENGEPYLDGVEWHNQNLSRRVQAVVEVCTGLSGKLPFIMLDDFEHVDAENRRMFEEGLAAAGYQVIEAVVTDGPLSIEIDQGVLTNAS